MIKPGLETGKKSTSSTDAVNSFVYRNYKKGHIWKHIFSKKGQISSTDYIALTKLELLVGGSLEGVFNFTEVPSQDPTGKDLANVKNISVGRFKIIITKLKDVKGNELPRPATSLAPQKLSLVGKKLFKDVKSKLTDDEKNGIADSLGFILSGNADNPFATDKESIDYPFAALITITDMNKDGVEEVFIQYGNNYTSGGAGADIILFIRDKQGVYRPNLNFPGIDPEQIRPGFGGYPDLLIGGPGFKLPVWRWDGKQYKFYRTQKMQQ